MYIKEYPNAFGHDFCNKIIENRVNSKKTLYEDIVYWNDGDKNTELQEIFDELGSATDPYLRDFLSQFKDVLNINDISLEGLGLVRQKEGTHDNFHYDAAVLKRDNNKILTRPFVCLIYLNDEFDGGELVFPVQKQIIKPQVGKMVIFPASYMFPHSVNHIVGGERFFIRLNFALADHLIDTDVDEWDVSKDGVMEYK